MKSFSEWIFEEVENEFQIARVLNHKEMEKWLAISDTPSELELTQLEQLRVDIDYHGRRSNCQWGWSDALWRLCPWTHVALCIA